MTSPVATTKAAEEMTDADRCTDAERCYAIAGLAAVVREFFALIPQGDNPFGGEIYFDLLNGMGEIARTIQEHANAINPEIARSAAERADRGAR